MSALLEAFRRNYLASQDAFRRHDIQATFAELPEDAVWEPAPEIVDRTLYEGRAAVIAGFQELVAEYPDWRTDVRDITEPEPGLIRVHFRATGTGVISGARTHMDVHQEWDFRSRPLHVREYLANQR